MFASSALFLSPRAFSFTQLERSAHLLSPQARDVEHYGYDTRKLCDEWWGSIYDLPYKSIQKMCMIIYLFCVGEQIAVSNRTAYFDFAPYHTSNRVHRSHWFVLRVLWGKVNVRAFLALWARVCSVRPCIPSRATKFYKKEYRLSYFTSCGKHDRALFWCTTIWR